jgi:hypothetical protein
VASIFLSFPFPPWKCLGGLSTWNNSIVLSYFPSPYTMCAHRSHQCGGNEEEKTIVKERYLKLREEMKQHDKKIDGVDGVLMQRGKVTCYESSKLKTREINYLTHDLDLLVAVHALNNFRDYLVGKHFKLRPNFKMLILKQSFNDVWYTNICDTFHCKDA